MNIDGIDLDGLGAQVDTVTFIAEVPGRVVHIDADFLAYQCSAEGKTEKSFADMQHNAEVAVELLRNLAGAERVHLHLTPKGSDKGKRYELAIQREYQANRKGKEKPKYLDLMREFLAGKYPSTMHMLCEADDGMSGAQYNAIAGGHVNLSVIASKGKDLRMVPGWQLNWDTGQLHYTDPSEPFGYVELVEVGTSKKLKGYGHKMFWAQMLTGDTADNIQGLPKIVGAVLNQVDPTAASKKLQLVALGPNSNAAQKAKAAEELASRAKACGPALAFKILGKLHNNKDAFKAVKALYDVYGEQVGFRHWETGYVIPWQRAFVSEAQLLWMRKDIHNHNDVLKFFKEECQ